HQSVKTTRRWEHVTWLESASLWETHIMYDTSQGRFIQRDPQAPPVRDANPYSYAGDNPVGFLDPSGAQQGSTLGPWGAKIVAVDLLRLQDRQVSYAFAIDLTPPRAPGKAHYAILSEDEKWGIREGGKEETLKPTYRLDASGPATIPRDNVSYSLSGNWAVFVRKATKRFGFLPIAKALQLAGLSNKDLDQGKYFELLADMQEQPVRRWMGILTYTYLYVNTKV